MFDSRSRYAIVGHGHANPLMMESTSK